MGVTEAGEESTGLLSGPFISRFPLISRALVTGTAIRVGHARFAAGRLTQSLRLNLVQPHRRDIPTLPPDPYRPPTT